MFSKNKFIKIGLLVMAYCCLNYDVSNADSTHIDVEETIVETIQEPSLQEQPIKVIPVKTEPSKIVKNIARDITQANQKISNEDALILSNKIVEISNQEGIDEYLLVSLIYTESRYDQKAHSSAGGVGLGQLTPICIEELNNTYNKYFDRYDVDDNILATAKYLKKLLIKFNNNTELALAAYNAGPTAIAINNSIPHSVQQYVTNINKRIILIKKED